jgi:hypothetical protein
MWWKTIVVAVVCVASALSARESLKRDSVLFQVQLSDDSTSLFACVKGGEIRKSLSGPVVMADGNLLFYSKFGYVLYSQAGAVLDSESVFEANRKLKPDDPQTTYLAYPLDRSTLLYYQENPAGKKPLTILQKSLFKDRLRPIKDEQYEDFKTIASARMFNLVHNCITDEMAAKAYLRPQLVGFGSNSAAGQWWSADRFYAFSSPLLHEERGKYSSFFAGIKESEDAAVEVKRQMVEPIAAYSLDGKWYYTGIYAAVGTSDERYNQVVFVCDDAGNCLYTDTILKQTNIDAVIGEVAEEKMLYTVKQTSQLVFQPSVDETGVLYYGVMDYENQRIAVHRREFSRFEASPSEPDLANLIDIEKDLAWEPVSISCDPPQNIGKTVPVMIYTGKKGERRKATPNDLTCDGYLVRITRIVYRDIEGKLARLRQPLPDAVRAIGDSIARISTSGCPYAISLSGPKGMLRGFDYPPGENVLCARVISVRESGEVIVRVDLDAYAEALVFDALGVFRNRFTFNRQNWHDRKDILVAAAAGDIIELDYEGPQKKPRFLKWNRSFHDAVASAP